MGFDYGRRKIGIAVGQTSTGFAEGIATIPADSPAGPWLKIGKLIERLATRCPGGRLTPRCRWQRTRIRTMRP